MIPCCLAARKLANAGVVVWPPLVTTVRTAQAKKYMEIHSPGIEPSVITVGAVNT
jgi:hypothetical protein